MVPSQSVRTTNVAASVVVGGFEECRAVTFSTAHKCMQCETGEECYLVSGSTALLTAGVQGIAQSHARCLARRTAASPHIWHQPRGSPFLFFLNTRFDRDSLHLLLSSQTPHTCRKAPWPIAWLITDKSEWVTARQAASSPCSHSADSLLEEVLP